MKWESPRYQSLRGLPNMGITRQPVGFPNRTVSHSRPKQEKMKTLNTAKQIAKEAATKLALSLTVVSVIGQLSTSPVMAQGMQAGQMEQLSQMSGLGADQESLLPPEVVPLDPQAAAKLSQIKHKQDR